MNCYRKFISTAIGFTFLVVGTTGIIFKFFFKTHPLENIHGWLGVAMVIAAVFHILQNWGSLKTYFRDWRVFIWLVPIVLAILFFSLAKEENRGPGPREVMAMLSHGSATDVAKVFGKDLHAIMAKMEADGIKITSGDESLDLLANENQKKPEKILSYFLK